MSLTLHHDAAHACAGHAREAIHPRRLRLPPIRAIARSLLGWIERSRQRQALLDLDDRMLADIGISRMEAREEAAKPFWV